MDGTAALFLLPPNQFQKCGFAGAIMADQRDGFARLQLKRQRVQKRAPSTAKLTSVNDRTGDVLAFDRSSIGISTRTSFEGGNWLV